MGEIDIFTDGSSLGNPGPGGYCGIIRHGKKETIVKGGEAYTTNNRMEMRAVIESLERIPLSLRESPNVSIHIYSDSRLVINTMTKGWRKKENVDLWKRLEELCEGTKIAWYWIKGHAQHKENNRADAFANKEAEKMAKNKSKGPLPLREKSLENSPKGFPFYCRVCKKPALGKLRRLESGLLRADCEHCGKFIKFAKHTKEILKRAQQEQRKLDF